MSEVVVTVYDPQWPIQFAELKEQLWRQVGKFAVTIEHVGSTAVPNLAAKPIIDIDIVIPDASFLSEAVRLLLEIGYEHRGNLGIEDRDAFKHSNPSFRHNLYVCPLGSLALRNHLALRDSLRSDSELREQYAALKLSLAAEFPNSIDDYIEGKTSFILKILERHGYGADSLEAIRVANRSPKKKRVLMEG